MNSSVSIREVMTAVPIVINADTAVEDAANLMKQYHVRHLPVLEGTNVLGVLTENDLLRLKALYSGIGTRTSVRARDIVAGKSNLVSGDSPLSEVADKMWRTGSDCAVIRDEGKIIGIFTVSDACRLLV